MFLRPYHHYHKEYPAKAEVFLNLLAATALLPTLQPSCINNESSYKIWSFTVKRLKKNVETLDQLEILNSLACFQQNIEYKTLQQLEKLQLRI